MYTFLQKSIPKVSLFYYKMHLSTVTLIIFLLNMKINYICVLNSIAELFSPL